MFEIVKRKILNSKMLASVGYTLSGELMAEFNHKGIFYLYKIEDVTTQKTVDYFQGIINGNVKGSSGATFDNIVKKGGFSYEIIDEQDLKFVEDTLRKTPSQLQNWLDTMKEEVHSSSYF